VSEETKPESDDAQLERNVEALMKHAQSRKELEPARLSGDAKERIRAELLAKLPRANGELPQPKPAGSRVRRLWPFAAGACTLAAAAALALVFTQSKETVPELQHKNATASPLLVTLRDGSRATLDVGAVLIERNRGEVVLEAGRAVFDVAADRSPLAVVTTFGRATAQGTRFLVSKEADAARVAVARGEVALADSSQRSEAVHVGSEGVIRSGDAPRVIAGRRISHEFAFAEFAAAESAAAEAPKGGHGNLTARDPGWRLPAKIDSRNFTLDVVVEAGFARTTVDQTFFNPTNRSLEGLYSFQVPHEATISRLAMYVDGTLMEGAVVDRSRGRDIYEGIVERRRDPALLEWMGGDAFKMRLFPLPGRSEKRVFLSYTELLSRSYDTTELSVPIPEFDTPTRKASVSIRLRGGAQTELVSSSFALAETVDGSDKLLTWEASEQVLGKDLVLRLREPVTEPEQSKRVSFEENGSGYSLIKLQPELRGDAARADAPRHIVVLLDASSSIRASALAKEQAFVSGLIDSVDSDDVVDVVAFGHRAETWNRREPLGDFVAGVALYGGDSRVDRALDKATALLSERAASERLVVYVGDGSFTSVEKPLDGAALAQKVSAAGGSFYGVGVGPNVDRGALDTVAAGAGGFVISVGEEDSAKARAFDFFARTVTPCLRDLKATALRGEAALQAAEVLIESPVVCDGAELRVLLKTPVGTPADGVRVQGSVGGKAWEKRISFGAASATPANYLPRLFAEWRVKELLRKAPMLPGASESPHQEELTKLGMEHFLVTPFTSLLVLENDKMYKQYGVEQRAPKGFAVYAAPSTIPVVTEPTDKRGPLSMAAAFEVVERSRMSFFSTWDQSEHHYQGIGLGGIGTIGFGSGIGSIGGGIRLSGIGEGGGGFGSIRMGGRLGGSHRSRPDWDSVSTRTLASRSPRSASPFEQRFEARSEEVFAEWGTSVGDESDWLRLAFTQVRPAAMRDSDAQPFFDLTEFARGLFKLPIDELDAALAQAEGGSPVRSPAFELLQKALVGQASRELEDPAMRLRVDGGVVTRELTLAYGLREVTRYDGEQLRHAYPELGLVSSRTLGAGAALWPSLDGLPLLPTLESLDGWSLEKVAVNVLRLSNPAASSVDPRIPNAIDWTFDAEARLVRVTHHGGEGFSDQRLTWSERELIVVRGGDKRVFSFKTASARPALPPNLLEVELPLRNPDHWTRAVAAADEKAQKIFGLQQQLASLCALSDVKEIVAVTQQLVALEGTLSLGEATLASLALTRGREPSLHKALPRDQGVTAYLSAFEKPSVRSFEQAATAAKGTFFEKLAVLRAGYLESAGVTKRKRAKAFVMAYPEAPLLGFLFARRAAAEGSYKQRAAFWAELSETPALGLIAAREQANAVEYGEPTDRPRALLAKAFDQAFERGLPIQWHYDLAPVIGYGAHADAFTQRLRSRVLERGTGEQVLAWMRMDLSENRYDRQESAAVYARSLAAVGDERQQVVGAEILIGVGRFESARSLLRPILADTSLASVDALIVGSRMHEGFGELDRAIELREKAFARTKGSSRKVEELRGWYQALLELQGRRLAADPEDESRVQAVLRVVAAWRAEEPGLELLPQVLARLFVRAGRFDLVETALSMQPELRPAQGSAWAEVGRAWAQLSELDKAASHYDRAVLVEPTDPTWRVERAKILLAKPDEGSRRRALEDLQLVKSGTWQERFAREKAYAAELLKELEVK
jgi:ferric-dicitrate binding protein FerR (iron transport regulator)